MAFVLKSLYFVWYEYGLPLLSCYLCLHKLFFYPLTFSLHVFHPKVSLL